MHKMYIYFNNAQKYMCITCIPVPFIEKCKRLGSWSRNMRQYIQNQKPVWEICKKQYFISHEKLPMLSTYK